MPDERPQPLDITITGEVSLTAFAHALLDVNPHLADELQIALMAMGPQLRRHGHCQAALLADWLELAIHRAVNRR